MTSSFRCYARDPEAPSLGPASYIATVACTAPLITISFSGAVLLVRIANGIDPGEA